MLVLDELSISVSLLSDANAPCNAWIMPTSWQEILDSRTVAWNAVTAAMRGRIVIDTMQLEHSVAESHAIAAPERINRIVLTGCGTSWHSALVGEYLIEEFARLSC